MNRTCRMPVVRLVAFDDRPGKFIFVRVPDEYGRYVRTDPCVAHVPCPHCKVTVGEPCRFNGSYTAGTHSARRRLGDQRRKGRPHRIERMDVIDAADGANVAIKEPQ